MKPDTTDGGDVSGCGCLMALLGVVMLLVGLAIDLPRGVIWICAPAVVAFGLVIIWTGSLPEESQTKSSPSPEGRLAQTVVERLLRQGRRSDAQEQATTDKLPAAHSLTDKERLALESKARRLAAAGRPDKAVQAVLRRTGCSYSEAEDFVFALPDRGWAAPEKGSTPTERTMDEARSVPAQVREAVLDRDDYICRYCGGRAQTMEVDHVIPVSQGGTSTLGNLVASCRDCNRKKGGRRPEEAGMEVLTVRTRRRDRG